MNKRIKTLILLLFGIIIIALAVLMIFKKTPSENLKQIKLESKYYKNGDYIDVTSEEVNSLSNESFILFTYNNYCSFETPCEEIFKVFMEKYKIDFLHISFDEFKNTKYYKTVKYAPSILIINKDKIVSYLDAESNEDIDKYQNSNEFTK